MQNQGVIESGEIEQAIDGEKITRLYSTDYYIDHLEEGEYSIGVYLNTNDHKEYEIGGDRVGESVGIQK